MIWGIGSVGCGDGRAQMNPVVNAIANRLSLRHRRSLRLTSTNCSCEPGQFKSAALDGIFVRDNA